MTLPRNSLYHLSSPDTLAEGMNGSRAAASSSHISLKVLIITSNDCLNPIPEAAFMVLRVLPNRKGFVLILSK